VAGVARLRARVVRLLGPTAAFLVLAGCTPFVTVARVSPQEAVRDLAASALSGERLTVATRNVLLEQGLLGAYDTAPLSVISQLHRALTAAEVEPDTLFALAEMSFQQAQKTEDRGRYFAAAVYAYAFLFPEGYGGSPGRFDPRLRLAAALYNRSLALAFASDDGAEVVPRGGSFTLPFAQMDVTMAPDARRVGEHTLAQFVSTADLEVRGLSMRYRRAGLGAPLAASLSPPEMGPSRDLLAPRVYLPVTMLLRIANARRALAEGSALSASLEIYLADEPETLTIGGEQVPLEVEPTMALAIGLSKMSVLRQEVTHFVGLRAPGQADETLGSIVPYRPGLIPVVFIHGTFSSAMRWAEMVNRLEADPVIRRSYQFWFYTYDSSNPIAYSALHLRRFLVQAVKRLDPDGKDPALSRMVLIGHSQGGLLAKMTVIDSGTRIWDRVSQVRLEDAPISTDTRELLREGLIVKPLPMVDRVVFISTPHRGSFVAGRELITGLVRRLVKVPAGLASLAADLARHPDLMVARGFLIPTALDNMSPRNPFINTLAEIPVAPGVRVHSIISVSTEGPRADRSDGVVEYASAHLEGVESELVVHSSHSTQSTPATMEEVRRILRLHLTAK
jgi:pimeloyl-ACP methyl ester carboxylesterase